MTRACLALALGAGLCAVGHAGAQAPVAPPSNPRVGIRLDAATCAEAVIALEKATGVALRLEPRPPAPQRLAEVERQLRERSRFDWTAVSLGAALDQLVARYRLALHAGLGGQLVLYPSYEPETAGTFHPASSIEVGGYRIGVAQTRLHRVVSDHRSEGDLSVSLQVEPLNGDVESLAGTEAVSAIDDQGTALPGPDRPFDGLSGTTLPGRWTTTVTFPAPAPRAGRLSSLRGKLVAYRKVTRYRAEFPLPLAPGGRSWREGGIGIENLEFKPGQVPPPEKHPERLAGGPTITAGIQLPGDFFAAPEFFAPYGGGRHPAPLLVGASGETYAPSMMRTRPGVEPAAQNGRPPAPSWIWNFPVIEEPLVRIVFRMLHKEQPEPILSFQLKDVPLPQTGAGRPPEPPVLTPARLEPGHRLFHAGGGRLVSPVQIGGRPAPPGTLHLGLSPCTPQTARGSEWFEAPVGPTGTARLADLAPGTYRVLRIFCPRAAAALPTAGIWRSAEAIVEVPARGEVVLPPLSWHENAVPTPRELKDRAHPMQPVAADDENRIEVREARPALSLQQHLFFLRKPLTRDLSFVSVTVAGATGANHSGRLLPVRNVVARDDRGTLHVAGSSYVNQSHRLWNTSLGFSGLSPRAERLDWIEGEVHAWTRVQPVRLEIPVTALKQTVKRNAEGVSVELTLTPGEGDDALKKPEANRPRRGLQVEGRIHAPTTVALEGPKGDSSAELVLVAGSGAVHQRRLSNSHTEISGLGNTRNIDYEFPALEEPASHIRLEFIVKSEPRRVGAFRITDVAIPRLAPPAAPVAPAAPRLTSAGENRPLGAQAPAAYFDPRGGNLVQQVHLAGQPASGGTLAFGFIREGTAGAQSVRWVEARVETNGVARVDGLKAGIYSVQARYRPPVGSPLALPGRWLNSRTRIRIYPGKAALLPPLEWRTNSR